jgi:N utilization substance protein B
VELEVGEKNMLRSTERIFELVIYQISFLIELVKFAQKRIEENKLKFYPTEDDLNPNSKFVENHFTAKFAQNRDYLRRVNAYKINWADENEMVRKIYNEMIHTTSYKKYMQTRSGTFVEDQDFIVKVFKENVAENDALAFFYEEKNISWVSDIDIANQLVIKIIKGTSEDQHDFEPLPSLYNMDGKTEPDEDKKYQTLLFHKVILKSGEYEKIVQEKASNWELNRIALMDIILIKMALAELLEFPSIPVKVTLNEYIELSKYFSTPKSSVFINGILDKLVADLKKSKKIVKIGRGLME